MNPFRQSPTVRSSRRQLATVLGILLPFLALTNAKSYVLEGHHWPNGETVELDLELGSPGITLSDGSTSWNQVAEAALAVWNPYLGGGVQLTYRETNYTASQGDGRNTVTFSNTIYGEAFGDDTLGITLSLYNPTTKINDETDVIFNAAKPFNSYRGPLRVGSSGGYTFDLQRVAIHEFGHVLGLDHVSQSAQSIMTPATSDIDTIQPDDIAGVESIYGNPAPAVPVIGGGLNSGGVIGQYFVYQIGATNTPFSYSASGLPPGLSVGTRTGLISGTPTAAGTYSVTISATNAAGTGTATLTLLFATAPAIAANQSATAFVGNAFYYQVVADGQPTHFSAVGLPDGLSINAVTGLISGAPTFAGVFRVGLTVDNAVGSSTDTLTLTVAYDTTLTVLHNFLSPDNAGFNPTALVHANDGNFYGTTFYGGDGSYGTFYRMTLDGTVTTFFPFSAAGGNRPVSLHTDSDGSFYGTTSSGGANGAGTVYRLTTGGSLTVVGSFGSNASGVASTSTALRASDGNYYGVTRYYHLGSDDLAGSIYKLTPDGTLTTLHKFNGADGHYPSELIQASDGNFYGTTYQGGSGGGGTVFKIMPDGTLTTLHNFTPTEGIHPDAALLQASDGDFYGTTTVGPNGSGGGTFFRVTPDGVFMSLHVFTEAAGSSPKAALVQGNDGNFYGTTSPDVGVGSGLGGTVFEITPEGVLTTLHTFMFLDGAAPFLALYPDADGNFYGGSYAGGTGNGGTIFKVTPAATIPVFAPPSVVMPTVTLAATTPTVTVGSGGAGVFTVTLSAAQDVDLLINYTIKGTATNGTDYVLLSGTKKIKAGKTSKPIKVVPQGDLGGAAKKTVVLTLAPGAGYTVGTTDKVKVKILGGP